MHDSRQSIERQPLHRNIQVTGFSGSRLQFSIATIRAVWGGRYDWVLIGHINLVSLTITALTANPFRPRTIVIAHGIEVWYGISRVREQALARVSKLLCVSEYTRRRILEQVPSLRAERLRIFPNALGETWAGLRHTPTPRRLPQRFISVSDAIAEGRPLQRRSHRNRSIEHAGRCIFAIHRCGPWR